MKLEDFSCYSEEDKSTTFLYKTVIGRVLLKILTREWVSKLVGRYMDSKYSKKYISKFIYKNNIDIKEYEKKDYTSFNDFFTRKIIDEKRPVDYTLPHFIAPCDGKLLAYNIDEKSNFYIKNSIYSVEELVQNKKISDEYMEGKILIFRLCVDDYHRYCYIDEGVKGKNIHIKGELHTVRPIAMERYKIYKRNTREYTLMQTKNFGTVCEIEVGAMFVGRIKNHHEEYSFKKGEEKGMFEFGGSTIVLLVKKNSIDIDKNILENSERGLETQVKMGQKIGVKDGESNKFKK